MSNQKKQDELLMAALLLNRFKPMAPHHVGALRERLGEPTDGELEDFVRTGKSYRLLKSVSTSFRLLDDVETENQRGGS